MTNLLEKVIAPNVKSNSFQTCKILVNAKIFPYIGSVILQELTPAKLDNWIRNLPKSGYSKNSLSCVHGLLHHALDYAVYPVELIASNPSNYIKVPKKAPTNIIKRYIVSCEKLAELLEKYPFGSPYYIPILILYRTGVRIGELLGLTWSNIDFDKKNITLNKQIVFIRRQGHYLTMPKTEFSKRFIVIDNFLTGEFKRWKNQQSKTISLPLTLAFMFITTNITKLFNIRND